MDMNTAYATWEKLHEDWLFANQAARLWRHEIEKSWESGQQPGPDMLEKALKLERDADNVMLAIKEHIASVFGKR